MNYGHPKMLWVMVAVLPLLGLFLWATWRKRQALVRQFVQHKALLQQTLGISTTRQKLRRVLLFFAVGFLLLAIARPQWGFTWEEAVQRGRDIIVAIDTSRSMLAEDIQPNRLTRAKLAALDLLQLGQFDRFGLVAFAGTAFLQCPLTFDDEAFRQNVELLKPGIIPQGGTAVGEAINAAREAFATDADENHRILILFTDGEDHEERVMSTVSQAAGEGIKIFTVGVGTAAGELLRVRDEQGRMQFVKDDAGNVVKSRLNEDLLKEIAANTGGSYVQLQGGSAMELLYQSKLAPLPTSERTTKLMKQYKEQFYWPLAAAILLLMIEVFVPEQKRAARAKMGSNSPTVPAAVTVILLLLTLPNGLASPAKANRLYNKGEYRQALRMYQELLAETPDDPRLNYNAGAAAYMLKNYDEALRSFGAAVATQNLDLQQQAWYNRANTEFRLGEQSPDPAAKLGYWKNAVTDYEAAIKINPGDKDAKVNLEIVKKAIEELEKKEQQQQQQNQNKDNKEENREDKDDQSQQEQQQNNQDEQQQQNKDSRQDQQEQQQNNQQEQRSEEEKQKEQQQQNQQKQDEQQKNEWQASKDGDQKETDQQQPQPEDGGEVAQLGTMTPAQARQLLDAQRDEEKALIFIPQERKSDRRNRTFKDW